MFKDTLIAIDCNCLHVAGIQIIIVFSLDKFYFFFKYIFIQFASIEQKIQEEVDFKS